MCHYCPLAHAESNSRLCLGYHLPRVRERDLFYARLEQERAAQRS